MGRVRQLDKGCAVEGVITWMEQREGKRIGHCSGSAQKWAALPAPGKSGRSTSKLQLHSAYVQVQVCVPID